MNDILASGILNDVLKNDLSPPSEEYDVYDYGKIVARDLSQNSLTYLVSQCLCVLPSSLAGSFLQGLLEGKKKSDLMEQLIDIIPIAKEVNSASLAIDIIISHTDLDHHTIALSLLSRLQNKTNDDGQNRIAYALYTLPKSLWSLSELKSLISELLMTISLTDYAKNILSTFVNK
jgi:hypothetical protein